MTDNLRTSLSHSEDLRVIDTRSRLSEAYVQAIADGSTNLSVVGLCKLAGVGRSTFYAHFATIEDLAVSMIGDIFREMSPIDVGRRATADSDRAQNTRVGVQELIDRLWSIRVVLVGAIRLPAGPAVQHHLIAEVVETTRGTVVAEQPHLGNAEVEMATHYIAGGVVQLILMWLDSPEIPREDLVETLLTLLPAWMT